MALDRGARAVYGISGGRHLDAIDLNGNLSIYEKYALHIIAAQMPIEGEYAGEVRWVYTAEIAKRASMSRRQVFRVLADLEKRGYIHRYPQKIQIGDSLVQGATLYEFTSKLFHEYEAANNVRLLRRQLSGVSSV